MSMVLPDLLYIHECFSRSEVDPLNDVLKKEKIHVPLEIATKITCLDAAETVWRLKLTILPKILGSMSFNHQTVSRQTILYRIYEYKHI
jgi:hypothetical protein